MKQLLLILTAIATAILATSCLSNDYPNYASDKYEWSLLIEQDGAPFASEVIECPDDVLPAITREGKDIIHTYKSFGGKNIDVSFRFTPYDKGKGVEITSTVSNNEKGFYVKSILGPVFNDPSIDPDSWKIYIPEGPGFVYSGIPALKDERGELMKVVGLWRLKDDGLYEIKTAYPSTDQCMQYSEFNDGSRGLYIASHDAERRYKNFLIRYHSGSGMVSYGMEHMMTCFTGQTVTNPSAIFWHHEGDWHVAADVYSKFFHSTADILAKPEWIDDCTGWMLTIMKQQNNELMWPYSTIGSTLTEAAKARGFNLLGLFGWTIGGHDKYYPEYDPDPAMGGEQGLKDGIRSAHEKGMKVIMYVNGQLIDTEGTEFWGRTGEGIVVRKSDGSDHHQMWQKYKDFPARHHGLACQSDLRWKEIMLNLAKQINSYGADGIIFDQLGTTGVTYCYSSGHGHPVPAIVYANDRVANLKYVADEMKKINPGFAVITEGIDESELNSISFFHLSGRSAVCNTFRQTGSVEEFLNGSPKGTYFSQMVKYTIPEWTSTDRTQSPADNRSSLNYCLLCGIRPEIECRYQPDVDYLVSGRMPQEDDYSNMISKVDISQVQALDIDAARTYTRQINEFLLENRDLFFKGRFMDTLGYTAKTSSTAVKSSAFVNGDRMGIVLWNASQTEEASYEIEADGWVLSKVTSPDKESVKPGDGIAPNSIHLVTLVRDPR